jgi:hypothetical protein
MLRKSYITLVSSVLLAALIISGAQILHKEWRTAYTLIFQKSFYKVNLARLTLVNMFEGVYRPLVASRERGLPEVRLYISEKSRNALMEDMPTNIKKWQRAFLMYPDGKLRPVKARHRGDNPVNWAFNKKSWRIKTRKKNLINNTRVFDYVVPQARNQFNMYLSYYFGKLAGVLAPEVRMVELFINDRSHGIYDEREYIGENFLRNRGLMPVNIYKGEQENRERQITIGIQLFDNPGLWSKTAEFNQVPETDFSDLKDLLNLTRKAETSDEHFDRLKRIARFEDWARFSAFQTLVQSWHNSGTSNIRLVSDPWRGTVQLIAHDTGFGQLSYSLDKTFPINFEGENPLPILALYQKSSEFLLQKFKILHSFVEDEIPLKALRQMEGLLPGMERSFSREYYRYEKVFINEHLASPGNLEHSLRLTTNKGMKEQWGILADILRWYQKELEKKISAMPDAKWQVKDGVVGLLVDGAMPVGNVTLSLDPGASWPKTIAWDADGDGLLSADDIQIPFRTEENKIILEADWIANQVYATQSSSDPAQPLINFGGSVYSVPTQFWLVSDVNLAPIALSAANSLTKEKFQIPQGSKIGNTPSHRNRPVIVKLPSATQVWPRVITVNEVRVVDQPVKILPGTVIRMMPGTSLIFRDRVQIEGTQKEPVIITSAKAGEPWGTVAFHGPNTKGSIISHLILENGSGAKVGSVRYIGMLSVHEGDNIIFKNLRLRDNQVFDDMMHVIYSKNILLQNCRFENAFSDGLDIDISDVRISGCQIENSGNDGIDLMSSRALIENSKILTSGDKAVSIGEASDVLVFNSKLFKNMIGVESKDGSTAHIINGLLVGNNIQLKAYTKNWRYGTGGTIVVEKSVFKAPQNSMSAKKSSGIKIIDSTLSPNITKKNKRVSVDALSNASKNRIAGMSNYTPGSMAKLEGWSLKGNPSLRGVVP